MSRQLHRSEPSPFLAGPPDTGEVLPGPLSGEDERLGGQRDIDVRRLREAVSRFFTPAGVELLRPMVEGTAEEVADAFARRLADNHVAGVWTHFALPLAGRVACGTVGVPTEDVDAVVPLALSVAGLTPRRERAGVRTETLAALRRYLDELLAVRRWYGGDDVTSLLLAEDSAGLTHEEVRQLVGGMLVAGVGPVARAVTRGVQRLVSERRWPRLADRRAAAEAAAETLAAFPLLDGWPGIRAGAADGAPCLDHLARMTLGSGFRFLSLHAPGLGLNGTPHDTMSMTVVAAVSP